MIKPILFIFLITAISLHGEGFCQDLSLLRSGKRLNSEQISQIIQDLIINNHVDRMDNLLQDYPLSFVQADLACAYYGAGISFYSNKFRMLALKSFMKGFSVFNPSEYQLLCGFYTSKIYYQIDNRNSALYYINRVLERCQDGSAIQKEALQLKRRIRWEYLSTYEGLTDDSVSDIEFDGDDVWLGMWTGGIARFTRSAHTLTLFKARTGGLISKHARSIAAEGTRLFVGTYDGLCSFDKKREKWTREDGALGHTTVKRLKSYGNRLYAATLGRGLYRYSSADNKWTPFFKGADNITDVVEAGGKVFVASLDKGLFIIEHGRIQNLLPDKAFKCLSSFGGKIWAGTHGGGMLELTADGKVIKNWTALNGLSSDYIEALEPFRQNLIIGTLGGGACVLEPKTGRVSLLNILEGLPSNDVVRITAEKDKIWFGTLSGGIGILLTENSGEVDL